MNRVRLAALPFVVLPLLAVWTSPSRAELCFDAVLDGTQAGTGSPGTGTGVFELSDDETVLSYHVNYSGLTGTETASHIHSDAEGGAVVKDIGTGVNKFGQWTSTDVIPMTPARVVALKAGQLYVNVHSTTFPGGEIKGQILAGPCTETCFEAVIDGIQAGTGSPGTGLARISLNHSETELSYWVEFSGLTSTETASHIHSNAESGAVVHNLGTGTPKAGVWSITDTPALDGPRVKALKAGLLYVNIHSISFPNGEISGTILPSACDPDCFDAQLDGAQAGTPSIATGAAFVQLSHARNQLVYGVTISGVVNETASHIHNDNEGGAVVHNLGVGQTKTGAWDNNDPLPLTKQRVIDLMNGQLYVNVHTTAYPAGEIRGQLNPVVCGATGVGDRPSLSTELLQNYPNPFNPSTTVAYVLARQMPVRVDIFDVSGRRVATIADGVRPAGRNEATWHGVDASGNPVASGVYFYRLVADGSVQTRKMVLVK
jgi:CHRD domain/FlgD Ig-like domain